MPNMYRDGCLPAPPGWAISPVDTYHEVVSRNPASNTPALLTLAAEGCDYLVHQYELGPEVDVDSYGVAVAGSLGVAPERLFKTLITTVDGEPAVAIVPVSRRLSLKGLARAAGGKRAEMAAPDEAERWTGYVTGGISPFGQKRRMPVFVDESIERFATVLASAGKRGLQVEVAPSVLIKVLDAAVGDLTE